mgnify:FL=1
MLAASVVAIAGSGSRGLRIELGPLLVHPAMLPLSVLLFGYALPRLRRFPRHILVPGAAFLFFYTLSMLQSDGGLGDLVKVYASFTAMMITPAILVQRESDYRVAVWALVAVSLFFALRALLVSGVYGANPFEHVANKNAFSLYVLPGAMLGAEIAVRSPPRNELWRWGLYGALIVVAASVFATANRSGWLGIAVIAGLLVASGRTLRVWFLTMALVAGSYVVLAEYGTTKTVETRWEETVEGYSSDDLRWELFREAWRTGLANPVLGVSPAALPTELARRTGFDAPRIDPHNVIGHIVGGGGLTLLAMFLWLGWAIWRKPRQGLASPGVLTAHRTLHMLLILWLVRGMFTREILYGPAFSIAVGVAIGRREAALRGAGLQPGAPLRSPEPTGHRAVRRHLPASVPVGSSST